MTDPLASLLSLEGVGSAFAATRDGIDVVLRDRGLRRTTPEQTAEALLRGAHASAVLAGSEADLADVRNGSGDATAQDAVRVSTELLGLASSWASAPTQALARIDVLAGGPGRPDSATAAGRLQQLAATVAATPAPALLVAAVVHAEVLTTHAFGARSGLVARAAERLVLVQRGIDPASVLVPEAAHLALRREYESNLSAYAGGRPAGVHAWMLYAAEAYARAAEESPLISR